VLAALAGGRAGLQPSPEQQLGQDLPEPVEKGQLLPRPQADAFSQHPKVLVQLVKGSKRSLAQASVPPAQPCLHPPARAAAQPAAPRASPVLVLGSLGQGRRVLSPLLSSGGQLGGISPSPSAGDVGPGGTQHPQHARQLARRGHGHHVSRFPATICHSWPHALACSRLGRLGKVASHKAGTDIFKQKCGGEDGLGTSGAGCGRSSVLPGHRFPTAAGRAGAMGRRGEQMPSAISPRKQIAVLHKQKPTSPRTPEQSAREADSPAKPRGPRLSAGAPDAGGGQDDAGVERARVHAPRFFGAVGNASLDSLPLSHSRVRGENLEAAGWNSRALFPLK